MPDNTTENDFNSTEESIGLTIARLKRLIFYLNDLSSIFGGEFLNHHWTDPFDEKELSTFWEKYQVENNHPFFEHDNLYLSELRSNKRIKCWIFENLDANAVFQDFKSGLVYSNSFSRLPIFGKNEAELKESIEIFCVSNVESSKKLNFNGHISTRRCTEILIWKKILFIARLQFILIEFKKSYTYFVEFSYFTGQNLILRLKNKTDKFNGPNEFEYASWIRKQPKNIQQEYLNYDFSNLVKNLTILTKIVDHLELWIRNIPYREKEYDIKILYEEWLTEYIMNSFRKTFRTNSQVAI